VNYSKQQVREGTITFQQLVLTVTNCGKDPLVVEPWWQEQVDKYEAELAKYTAMTPEEAEAAQQMDWEAKEYEISQSDELHATYMRNYRNMIRQVTDWTASDETTKKDILDQLNDDLRTDCGVYDVPRNKKIRTDAWLKRKIEELDGLLSRAKDDLIRQTNLVNKSNEFRSKILESLGLTP
jgi:hypothetical protein